MLLLALACHADPAPVSTPVPTPVPVVPVPVPTPTTTTPIELVGVPTVRLIDDADAYLVGEVEVHSSVPTSVVLHVTDPCGSRRITFPTRSTDHVLPLLGLHAGASHEVRVELLGDADPLEVDLGTLDVPVPPDLPQLTVNALDPERIEPTLLFLPVRSAQVDEWLLVLDPAMHVIYGLRSPIEQAVLDPTNGTWVLMDHEGVLRKDMLGNELERWSVAEDRWTHEVQLLPNGDMLSLQREQVYEDEYPIDLQFSGTRRALLGTDKVIRVNAAHELVEEHSLASILDTQRVGYLSINRDDPQDWSHANAVVPWGDDAYLVSVRHLDVVACVNRDGTLRWLLGDPTAWESPWAEAFLVPVGPIQWPRHQHAVEVHGSQVVLFDNRNFDGSPYNPGEPGYVPESRAAAFRIDEAAGTVTADWSIPYEGLFSYAMGDADVLPVTGNVQITFANIFQPVRHSRVVQVHPDDPTTPALDLAVGLDASRFVYRTLWGPSLYASDVVDERVPL